MCQVKAEHAFLQSEQEQKERQIDCRELLHKREKAYWDFMSLYWRVLTAVALKCDDNIVKNAKLSQDAPCASQVKNDFISFLGQNSDAIASVRLYGTEKMIGLVMDFLNDINHLALEQEVTKERILEVEAHLSRIAQEMNSEIAQFMISTPKKV